MDADIDWISARDALDLLKAEGFSEYSAKLTICKRANAGLVRARADLVRIGEAERIDHEVPRKLWWAEGHEALEQNWKSGDFSTWVDHKHHIQAYGVQFALDDITSLSPNRKVNSKSERISEDDQVIERRLETVSETAALSWRQAVLDLADEKRISFRGPALEMREALREVLDALAPESEVQGAPGYKHEAGQSKPTQKQRVRYLLKSRGAAGGSTAEDAILAFEESIAKLTRSVYQLSSKSTHVASQKEAVIQIRRYLSAVLHDILDP